MQYTVVHSKDPYLLARLATDITLHTGIEFRGTCKSIHDLFNPDFQWMDITKDSFNFQCHRCVPDPIRHELTSRNYIKVLTKILEP